ncbi:MAG: type VI secretion system baseplate subunit TssE [Pyrinomonadaceae bacterium]
MSLRDNEIRITPSILDRLIDYDPKNSQEAPKSRSQSLRELKQAVRRDVEWLLNTRTEYDDIPEGLVELRESLAAYGLPEFINMSSKDTEDRKTLTRAIEKALVTFEPRFINLQVTLKDLNRAERGVRFQIEANLNIEPTPEPIVFDTVLQVGSGDFEVSER